MTTKRLLTYFGVAFGLVCLVIACKEEFLDGTPQGTLDQNTLANQFGVEANLIATYSILDGHRAAGNVWGASESNWVFGSVASDDAYKGSEPGDQQPISDIELYQWGTSGTDNYMNDKWSMLYEGISRANSTINLLNSVLENDPNAISADDQDRILGEALFLRAHYHFDGWKVWNNIPYYIEEDTDFRKTNVGVDPVPLILSDLDRAISLLPTSQAEVGRVNQWTAKAYKGKVLVYNQQWSEAKAVLDDVVNNGPYALQDCFHDIFSLDGENGSESILAYQASSNDGDGGGNNGNNGDRLTHPHSGNPFGCCGFHQPSQNLVNAFRVDGNGLPLFDSFNESDEIPGPDVAVDPRLDWTVGRDGVPFLDWGIHEAGWIRDRPYSGPYSPKKNIYEQGSGAGSTVGWNNNHLSSLNMQIYRYSELLLLLAETKVESNGDLECARELVNMVRTRAANCAQGPEGGPIEVAIDDPAVDEYATYRIGTYDAPWTGNTEAAREAVRWELRLETAMEGHRFFNLRRWGIDYTMEVLNDYLAVEQNRRNYLTGANSVEPRHELYPLPTVQIELSEIEGEDRLVQNPNW